MNDSEPEENEPILSSSRTNLVKDEAGGFEETLTKLGGFSWFQIWATFVIIQPEIPAAMISMMPIFVGTNSVTFDYEFSNSSGTFIKSLDAMNPLLCSGNGTIMNLTRDGPVISIVQEWRLICGTAWLTDLFTSIQMLGMMSGCFAASQLADAYGRKIVYFGNVAMMGVFGIASGFSPNIYVYAVTKFFVGAGVGGYYVLYVIYLMEFLTPNWRTISGCLSIWSVGLMVLSLLAYLLPDWRHLTWAGSAPALAYLTFCPFIPESPRWLLCKQRTLEAHKGFLQMAKMNRKPPLSVLDTEKLQVVILAENSAKLTASGKLEGQSSSVLQIFSNSTLLGQIALFTFGWFSTAFVYYGMSFNTKNLSGNPYLNVLYLGLVDLPAFPSGVLFNNWLGRRKTYAGYWMFATIFLVALVLVDQLSPGKEDGNHHESVSMWVSILCYLGRFGVSGAWGVVTCFTAEAFPTTCRSTALGLGALSGNIAGVLAPQLVFLGTISSSLPYFIFAGLSFATAGSAWLLNETNEQPLKNFVKS